MKQRKLKTTPEDDAIITGRHFRGEIEADIVQQAQNEIDDVLLLQAPTTWSDERLGARKYKGKCGWIDHRRTPLRWRTANPHHAGRGRDTKPDSRFSEVSEEMGVPRRSRANDVADHAHVG